MRNRAQKGGSPLHKILDTFHNKPQNLKEKDLFILANLSPEEIMAVSGLSKKGANDIMTNARSMLSPGLRIRDMAGGTVAEYHSPINFGLAEPINPEPGVLQWLQGQPQEQEWEPEPEEEEDVGGPEDAFEYEETVAWLKDVFPDIRRRNIRDINAIFTAVHDFLQRNFMLRLDNYTMTEILDDNNDAIKDFVYNTFDFVERDH